MKKVLNYEIGYELVKEIGTEAQKEVFYTKMEALTRYLNILTGDHPKSGVGSISLLKINVVYVNCGTEDITAKVNKFIAY